jgi:hypothetical protein
MNGPQVTRKFQNKRKRDNPQNGARQNPPLQNPQNGGLMAFKLQLMIAFMLGLALLFAGKLAK